MEIRQTKNIGIALRNSIMIACVAALIFFGSALITVGTIEFNKSDSQTAFTEILIPVNSGSMAKNEHRDSERSMTLSMPALLVAQTLETVKPHCRIIEYKSLRSTEFSRYMRLTTTASISPEKALEFTLVGAKPSGTS